MNDHADTLRNLRADLIGHAPPKRIAALDAAIAALEAGRSGEAGWPTEAKRVDREDWKARTALSEYIMDGTGASIWNACLAACKRAAAPQQPHPVGVTDAMRLDWLEQVRDRFYNIDHIAAIVGKGFLTQVGDAPMPGHFPNLREAIDSAAGFSHQQPSPSECCNTFPCKASTADNGACPVAAPSVSDLTNCRVPHSKYDACHNCDDPSAQDRECRCDFRTKLVGDGCEVCNPPHAAPEPAASGEGLPEIPTPHGGWNAERNEYDYTPAQLIAYAIEARRLTTTGQGDVERLVEAGREVMATELADLACTGSMAPCEDAIGKLRDALAPFGQQQESQG